MPVKITKKRQILVINPAQANFLKSAQSALSGRSEDKNIPGLTFAKGVSSSGPSVRYNSDTHTEDFTNSNNSQINYAKRKLPQTMATGTITSRAPHKPIKSSPEPVRLVSPIMRNLPKYANASGSNNGSPHKNILPQHSEVRRLRPATSRPGRTSVVSNTPPNHNPFNPSDTEFGVFGGHDVLQPTADVSAGWGDTVGLGAPKIARKYIGEALGIGDANDAVQYGSLGYHAGEVLGTIHSTLMNAAGGIKAVGVKAAGKEFSHWIPERILKKSGSKWAVKTFGRSKWNGNYVTPQRHFQHDPFRYLKNYKTLPFKRFSPPVQQLDRVPRSIYGTVGGASAGQIHRAIDRKK